MRAAKLGFTACVLPGVCADKMKACGGHTFDWGVQCAGGHWNHVRAWVGMGIGMGRESPMSVKRSSLRPRPLGQEKYFFEKTVDTFSNLWYSN